MPCGATAAACNDEIFSDTVSESNYLLPNTRGFKLASLNITSLVNHIDELRVFIAGNRVDVLAINETGLDSNIIDSEVHIPGYEIIRRDRYINGRHGGGVCFFVHSTISFLLRPDLSCQEKENLCIEIRKPNSKPFSHYNMV